MKNLFALLAILSAFLMPTMATAQALPVNGYQTSLSGDPAALYDPLYTYRGVVREVYDSDTIKIDMDLGFQFWNRDVNVRLAGTNAYEIKRSSSKTFRGLPIDTDHVNKGYQCRDLMIVWLGGNPANYPRKVGYHDLMRKNGLPITDLPESWYKYGGSEIVVQTLRDESGKFGRPLVIIWKDGHNLNQWLVRSGCADLNWYDGNTYDVSSPITPR